MSLGTPENNAIQKLYIIIIIISEIKNKVKNHVGRMLVVSSSVKDPSAAGQSKGVGESFLFAMAEIVAYTLLNLSQQLLNIANTDTFWYNACSFSYTR